MLQRRGVGPDGVTLGQVASEQGHQVGQPDGARRVGVVVAAGERQLEVELAQAIGKPEVEQRPIAGQRPQRAGAHRDQSIGEVLHAHVDRPPDELLSDVGDQVGTEVVGRRVRVLEHCVDQRPEGRPHWEVGHR